ncbi:MAG: hypothetical protein ABIY48_05965, partial [Acidimicrobiales bacterium]
GVFATVHDGPLVRARWSDLVCFAGLGPGELTDAAGRKVLGISQRRTRAGARFQCAALGRWDPSRLVSLLAPLVEDDVAAIGELADAASGMAVDLSALLQGFLARLP